MVVDTQMPIFPSEARSLLGLGRGRMASMAISCVSSKTLPFFVNLDADFFSTATTVKHITIFWNFYRGYMATASLNLTRPS